MKVKAEGLTPRGAAPSATAFARRRKAGPQRWGAPSVSFTCARLRTSAAFTWRPPPCLYLRLSGRAKQRLPTHGTEMHITESPQAFAPSAGTPAKGVNWGRFAALAIAGTLALALSAKVQIPFYPVPMTLQTLAVLAIGGAFGLRLAADHCRALSDRRFARPSGVRRRGCGADLYVWSDRRLSAWLPRLGCAGWRRRGSRLDAFIGVACRRDDARPCGDIRVWFRLAGARDRLLRSAWAAGVAPFYVATLVKTALAVAMFSVWPRKS